MSPIRCATRASSGSARAHSAKESTIPAPVSDYQYILAPGSVCPSSFTRREVAGRAVAFDARLPLFALRDRTGRSFGTVLGFAFDTVQKRRLGPSDESFAIDVPDATAFEREVIPRLAGAFLILTHDPLAARIYLDPGGSLPLVFSPEDRRAASSTGLLLDEREYEARFNHALHDAMIVREGTGGWISGTLTAHHGVERVLPNHYLDLQTWTAQRHWPERGDFRSWRPFDEAVVTISSALQGFTELVCHDFRTALSLTAGFDSRLLLASARRELSSCSFFTFTAPGGQIDVEVAGQLATQFGLRHQKLLVQEASDSERALWDRTVGDCMVEQNRVTHPTLRRIDADAIITGMYGELGRCRLYRQDFEEINSVSIDPSFVVSRLALPSHPQTLASVATWFDAIAHLPNSVILDLAFLELKFGSWAMGQHPLQNSLKLHFMPFAQRSVLDAFLGVEPCEKGTDRLFTECIRKLWPELTEVPVNKYGDYRDYLVVLGKLARPSRVRRFLRDRLAKKTPR